VAENLGVTAGVDGVKQVAVDDEHALPQEDLLLRFVEANCG
jgi:hypothetical protein